MYHHQNIQTRKTLYFTRWSNKSYAVFCTVGKLIYISSISRLLEGLNTVKSSIIELLVDGLVIKVNNELETYILTEEDIEVQARVLLFPDKHTVFIHDRLVDFFVLSLFAVKRIIQRPQWAFFCFATHPIKDIEFYN